MSDYDVYDTEMATWKLTDHDVERVLSSSEPEDVALARLHAALAALHRLEVAALSETHVEQLVARAAALSRAGDTVAGRPAGTGRDHDRKRASGALRHRLALVGAAVFLISGMTGVAVASDDAVPGDRLYGLDRALERVGIGVGGAAERITEAQALASSGQMTAAINHAAEAVEESEVGEESNDFSPEASGAATALRDAAESVRGDNDDPESQQIRDAVAAMLGEMANMAGDPDFDGEAFGRRVSDLARSIGDRGVDGAGADDQPGRPDRAGGDEDVGPPSQVPGGPPEGTRGGRSGGAGRP